jgi:hypothetical protein
MVDRFENERKFYEETNDDNYRNSACSRSRAACHCGRQRMGGSRKSPDGSRGSRSSTNPRLCLCLSTSSCGSGAAADSVRSTERPDCGGPRRSALGGVLLSATRLCRTSSGLLRASSDLPLAYWCWPPASSPLSSLALERAVIPFRPGVGLTARPSLGGFLLRQTRQIGCQ